MKFFLSYMVYALLVFKRYNVSMTIGILANNCVLTLVLLVLKFKSNDSEKCTHLSKDFQKMFLCPSPYFHSSPHQNVREDCGLLSLFDIIKDECFDALKHLASCTLPPGDAYARILEC